VSKRVGITRPRPAAGLQAVAVERNSQLSGASRQLSDSATFEFKRGAPRFIFLANRPHFLGAAISIPFHTSLARAREDSPPDKSND
jgi:hypothetical protein